MSSVIEHYRFKMTEDDSAFFEALGQRIATLRKAQNMTQGQLGLYVLENVRRGQHDADNGNTESTEELLKEIKTW